MAMREHDFALRFRLPDAQPDPESHLEALREAGCDDATVGVGRQGRIALEFTRDGRSAAAAMRRAIRDVQRAIPGAELLEASPDYVGVTEIAAALGMTRQGARKMIETQPDFPAPVHEGSSALYRLALVLAWCARSTTRPVDPAQLEVAKAAMQQNHLREQQQVATL
jgi:hypothetical protein